MTLQEILFIVSVVFFALAVVCIGLAVAIFFARNIPDVRADLSGKKRADAVAQIAAQRSGRDRRKGVARVEPTSGNLDSGRLRESSPLDNRLNQVPHVNSVVTPAPAQQAQPLAMEQPESVMAEQPHASYQSQPSRQVSSVSPTAEKLSDDLETSILPEDNSSTTILPDDDSSTTILPDDSSATTILKGDNSATAVLPSGGSAAPALAAQVAESSLQPEVTPSSASASEGFIVVRKIVLRESGQVIQAS